MRTIDDVLDRIVRGDCVEIMAGLPAESVDLVITDPPYLVRYRSSDGRRVPGDDDPALIVRAFAEVGRLLKPHRFAVSFYGWNRIDVFARAWRRAGLRPVGHLVWHKQYWSSEGLTRRFHEQAYLLAKSWPAAPEIVLPDVLEWRYTGDVLHPTQKPIMAIRPLVMAYSRKGEVVLDPFVGSGTTALAAHQLGRRYIGIELSAGYARIARERLRRHKRE